MRTESRKSRIAPSRVRRSQERRARKEAEAMRPCTAETKRCIVAQSYAYDLPPCCRAHTANLVHTVGDALTAAGVTWWLDYGSLLGAVRNPRLGLPGGIIAHDKDADLGFLGEDWPKILAICPEWKREKGAGEKDNEVGYALGTFQWLHKMPRRELKRPGAEDYLAGDSIKVRLSAINHSNVDLFPWYDHPFRMEKDGRRHRYHYVAVDRCKGREFPEDMLLPLGQIEFEGKMCPCPADPERFVAHRYGRTWEKVIRRNNAGVRVR